jgi:uncharacterized cupin superfamily protein
MSQTPSSVNADGIYEPFSIERVPWVEHSHGGRFGMRFRELGQYGGGRHAGVCLEVLEQGRQSNPAHYHIPCRYLIIGERNPSEAVVYTDSGVGVRLTGEGYRKSATMDYWAGEDTGAP